MRYFKKTHPDIKFKKALHFFGQKIYEDAEKAINETIDELNDKQSLKLAYLLRAQIFKQKNQLDLAFKDLEAALSKAFFDVDVLSAMIELSKTGHPLALDLLNNTLTIWLYYRPQDYANSILLDALTVCSLDAFGIIDCDAQGNVTGWFYSPNEKTIVIEIDTAVICHTCHESRFFDQIHKEIYPFSLKLPEQFTHCRIGILGKKSLWGSPMVRSREFHFSSTICLPNVVKQVKTVDVIIPVYSGFEETKACLESVYATLTLNQTPMRLLIVNDASPDKRLSDYLKQESHCGKITLIERAFNVGFVGAVNTGLAHSSSEHDVVLLNADTIVVSNWLDRLQAISQSESNIGTVTPISNNAELLSYPHPMTANPMPDLQETKLLDELFSRLGADALHTIPSGVGFCFYIRRALLQEQPFLNEKLIQRGYGEETEFCLKAAAKGWKNVVAANVFVAHKGGVSFGEEKQALARYHVAQIHARFPRHSAEYDRFLHQKPLQPLFQKVNERRMALQ
jgi:GT2 family glycosyltransferase